MMWLLGFKTAQSGSRLFDAAARPAFEAALLAQCAKHPGDKLLDVLKGFKFPSRGKPAAKPPA
jgi:hypothetical protein